MKGIFLNSNFKKEYQDYPEKYFKEPILIKKIKKNYDLNFKKYQNKKLKHEGYRKYKEYELKIIIKLENMLGNYIKKGSKEFSSKIFLKYQDYKLKLEKLNENLKNNKIKSKPRFEENIELNIEIY